MASFAGSLRSCILELGSRVTLQRATGEKLSVAGNVQSSEAARYEKTLGEERSF